MLFSLLVSVPPPLHVAWTGALGGLRELCSADVGGLFPHHTLSFLRPAQLQRAEESGLAQGLQGAVCSLVHPLLIRRRKMQTWAVRIGEEERLR